MALSAITPHIEDVDNLLSHCHRKSYPNRSTIIYEGDKCDTLYYIIKGSNSVALEDDEGKEVVITYLNPGDFFGEMGLFAKAEELSALCRARNACEVTEIICASFNTYIRSHSERVFTINTTRKVDNLAFYDVTDGIARTLIDLSKEPDAMTHPEGMQIRISRQEIGRLVNCSREMAGRVLKTLEEQELVSVSGRTMVVFGVWCLVCASSSAART